MKQTIVENGITYELCGEQYYPLLKTPEQTRYYLGKDAAAEQISETIILFLK